MGDVDNEDIGGLRNSEATKYEAVKGVSTVAPDELRTDQVFVVHPLNQIIALDRRNGMPDEKPAQL